MCKLFIKLSACPAKDAKCEELDFMLHCGSLALSRLLNPIQSSANRLRFCSLLRGDYGNSRILTKRKKGERK